MANRFLSNITINDSYTLPSADGSNGQVITTDGSGNLSFSDIDLAELHDVNITSQANGDLLQWNNTAGVWENKTLGSIADSRYVNVSGDTMTGNLVVKAGGTNASITLDPTQQTSVYALNIGVTDDGIKFSHNSNSRGFVFDRNGVNILTLNANTTANFANNVYVGGSLGVTNIVTNKVVKFDGTFLNDSSISDDGSLVTVDGSLKVINGGIYVQNSTDHGAVLVPEGGYYRAPSSPSTGAIKITLPTHGTIDMIGFTVDIYDYQVDESITVFIKGYLYQTTGNNEWVHPSAQVIATKTDREYAVRFGADGTNNCVWIGEIDSPWSWLQVQVRDFFGGFSTDIDAYDNGWSVSVVTAFDTVDEILTDTFPQARNADTVDGLEASQFLRSDTNSTINGAFTVNGGTGNAVINVNASGDSFVEKDNGDHLYFANNAQDKNIYLRVNDGGTYTNALTINGSSTNSEFSGSVTVNGGNFSVYGSASVGSLILNASASETTISGDTSGNIYFNNSTGEHRFRANGSTVNSVIISSSSFIVNETTTINANAQIDGHLSILDAHSLYMFAQNGAKVNLDARDDGTGAMLHKWNRNSEDTVYLSYYENWYDGNSYHQIGVEDDTWRIGTRGGDGVLYVGDLDASTNGALNANKQGIVIQGTGGRLDNPQDGTERLPTLQFFDSVTNYGSGTATAGELRGGVEWYSSETSGGFPAISGAIYSVNENAYNSAMGLAFYTNNSQATPSEAMRLTAGGDLDLVGRDFKIGGTTVIDENRNATLETLIIDDVSWNTNKVSIQGDSPNIEFRDTDSSSYYWQLGANGKTFYILHDTDRDGNYESTFPFYVSSDTSVGYLYGSRIFADNYHPNADKWTSARTITLGGDLTGSVSIDGSSNVTLSAQVVNDSHTHDGRYYTEAEVDYITAQSLGWVPAYSNADVNTVFWNQSEQAVQLQSGSDTAIGMAYKAIRMKAGDKVRVTVMVKSAFAATSGLYLRLYFHNGNLPDGKTHVSHSASYTYVQEDDSGDTSWYEDSAIGTSWQNFERTYTAPADGYMSLVILNWTGLGNGAIYVKQPDIQFEKVNQATSADLADQVDIIANDTFSGTYPIVWRDSTQLYSSTWMTVTGASDTFNVPNIYASDKIRIGTTATDYPLNIQANSGSNAIRIIGRSDNIGSIVFANNANDTNQAFIQSRSNELRISPYAGNLKLYSGSGERIDVNTDGITYIARVSGKPTIKGNNLYDSHFIIDSGSSSDAVWFQNYNSGNVYMVTGGGSVGIGLTSVGYKLHVNGDAKVETSLTVGDSGQTNTYLYLLSSTSGTSNLRMGDTDTDAGAIIYDNGSNQMKFRTNAGNRVFINSDGRVGINKSDPGVQLDVAGAIRSVGSITDTSGAVLGTYSGGTDITASAIILGSNGKTGWAVGDEFGAIRFYNTDGSGVGARDAVKIIAWNNQGNGTSTTTFDGNLSFYTSLNNAQATENLRLTDNGHLVLPNGNLGIGISAGTTPSDNLIVSGDAYITGGTNYSLKLGRTSGKPNIKAETDDGGYLLMDSNGGLAGLNWYTSDDVALCIGGGDVGIGTSSPAYKLDVNGHIRATTVGNNTDQTRDKLRVWSGTYTIGFKNGYTYGSLSSYAMSFQVNTTSGRGWWWGTSEQSDAQGCMALDNEGRLTVATALSVGEGTSITSPYHSMPLNVNGRARITDDLFLGDVLYHDGDTNTYMQFSSDRVRFYAGGLKMLDMIEGSVDHIRMPTDVSIGQDTDPAYALDVGGTIRATGDVIAYSDARVKENVKTIDNALDKVTQLRGVSYNKIGETEEKIGVIAQEIEKVLPQVVQEDAEGMKSVAYGNIVGVLIEAIKEQQKQIDELKAMINKK